MRERAWTDADCARAEITLERGTVKAATWHTRGARKLLRAGEIANVVASWQPGMDAADAPGNLRLEEGECPEYEIRLVLSPHLQIRLSFLGRLQNDGQVVTGIGALSQPFKKELDRARLGAAGGGAASNSPRLSR
ncbi:MAG: hypothetical protein IT207_05870 [Fimbriimonadaceae bacterium]|nr:hypothetical protein [Fimbriimonadaceae bacterium]